MIMSDQQQTVEDERFPGSTENLVDVENEENYFNNLASRNHCVQVRTRRMNNLLCLHDSYKLQ